MTELAKILKGSQNYGLAGPDSDEDYVSIVTPSLVEIYYNKTFNTKNEHLSIWTLPLFVKRFLSADPTALELCFSCKAIYYNTDFYDLVLYLRKQLENGFLRSVWPQYYDRIFGMIYSDMKNVERSDWEPKRRLKVLSRAIYYLDLIISVYNTNGCLTENNYREQIGDKNPYQIKFNHDISNISSDYYNVSTFIESWKPQLKQVTWPDAKKITLDVDTMAIDIMKKFIK